jgi:hypothetical protein
MRIPDPKANTTTEAYLAYKAGYLEQSELKPVLYEPYLHFDGWLAYWAGLTTDYPHGTGKNLAPSLSGYAYNRNGAGTTYSVSENSLTINTPARGAGVYITRANATNVARCPYLFQNGYVVSITVSATTNGILRIGPDVVGGRIDIDVGPEPVRVSFETRTNNIIFYQMNQGTLECTISDIQCERGSTATDYEPYTVIPEMLNDEEALVAYLSGVTDTYPEEIKDPYDVRIVGYLKHLVSARWPEPDYPVNNQEFYLSTMKPPVVTNDTPSADIELDDTAEAPFIDVKAYGDTSQTTYTGKNLADAFGGTWVKNNAENELIDGVYKMTANSGVIARVVLQLGGLVEGETYTLSFYSRGVTVASDASWTYARVREGQGGGEWISDRSVIATSDDYVKRTITFTANSVSDPWVWFYVAADNRNTNNIEIYIKDIQLEAGSTATSYEPYTGGVPAPNPDYPQDVNVVTGRQVVNIKSQNLFDWQSLDHTNTNDVINATLDEILDNGVIVTGNVSSSTADFAASKGSYQPARNNSESAYRVHIPEGSTVSISADITLLKTGYHASTRLHLDRNTGGGYGNTGEGTALVLGEKIRASVTFQNVEEGDYWPTFMLNSNYMKIENIQIELSDSPTQYGEYGNVNYEINLGKNLFTFGYGSGEFQGITWTRNGNTVVGVGTATGNYTDTGTKIDLPAPLKAGQDYVFSIPAPVSFGCSLYLFDKNGQVISPSARINAGETSVVFNKEVDIYQARITLSDYGGAGKELNVELRAQIELGSTATGYAPQFEPIELCKIGDYQDYIYRDEDGDWYVHKEIGKYVFDGSENWVAEAYGTNSWRVNVISIYEFNADEIELKCDFADGVAFNNRGRGDATKTCICYTNSSSVLVIRNTTITTKEAMQTNTAGKRLFYKATPTDTQITNSELISQLDALMEGGSYEGKTYIKVTATDPNLPGLLYVEAGKYD